MNCPNCNKKVIEWKHREGLLVCPYCQHVFEEPDGDEYNDEEDYR